jgi:hypothetical protein
MVAFLCILAALEFVGGLVALAAAESDLQETAGIFLVGFGILSVGLASILEALKSIRLTSHRQAAALERIQMNLTRTPDDVTIPASPPRSGHVLDDLPVGETRRPPKV